MRPAIRSQAEDPAVQEIFSQDSALDCSESEDMARQEFKDDSNINVLLARFGLESLVKGNPIDAFTEVDFDLDLLQAMDAIGAAKSAFGKLHPDIQQKFPTWQDVLTAIDNGTLTMDANGNPLDLTEDKAKMSTEEDKESDT